MKARDRIWDLFVALRNKVLAETGVRLALHIWGDESGHVEAGESEEAFVYNGVRLGWQTFDVAVQQFSKALQSTPIKAGDTIKLGGHNFIVTSLNANGKLITAATDANEAEGIVLILQCDQLTKSALGNYWLVKGATA